MSNYKDCDGFDLIFDENTSETDKIHFIAEFPNIDEITAREVHCTSCYEHIGTAPIKEKTIRTHTQLGVTQCKQCYDFYVSR